MLTNFDDSQIAFIRYNTTDLKIAKFLFDVIKNPIITKIGIGITKTSLALDLPIEFLIKKTLFKQFCGGTSLEEAGSTAQKLKKFDVQVILDYGVESKKEEEEFDKNATMLMEAALYASQKNIPFICIKISGLARFKLLEKAHKRQQFCDSEHFEWQRIEHRINQICYAAAQKRTRVLIDAEESWIQEGINILAERMMETFNTEEIIVYNTFQMYTKGALPYLRVCLSTAKEKNYLPGIKIVRGAYIEKEKKRAQKLNYPDPIQIDKLSTDRDFDEAVELCLRNIESLGVFIGTHNENSCLKAIDLMAQLDIPVNSEKVYFSQLYGMSDNISFNLALNGYKVAKYLPYGPVEDVIPYLIRRAQENTSVAGQTNRELVLINSELKRRRQQQTT